MPVAYGMTGSTLLGDRREPKLDTILFNFCEQFAKAIESINTGGFDSLLAYMRAVSLAVLGQLIRTCESNEHVHLPDREFIIGAFMDGYFRNNPERVDATFTNERGKLNCEVQSGPLGIGIFPFGSEVVARILATNAEFRAKFQYPLPLKSRHRSENINILVRDAWTFIEACSSDEGRALDPDKCWAIGGKIHIATITRADSFRWVPGFEHG